jgi:iron complex outermembrane receptor protein
MLMFQDLMWPQATITDGGLFTRGSHTFNDRWKANATVRLDLVSAKADTASPFFRQNVSTDLSSNEVNVSGSGTVNYNLAENWTLGLGLGSVVRTAQATERFSDRIPASKAQTSAEFVGNPQLKPERSTQADLWINAAYANWDLSVNVFARQMANYITLGPTNLPKRLPLSPNTVYQYINGSARFWGFDISSDYQILPELQLNASVNYLWGRDTEVDEPALGVAPFEVDPGLRYEFQQRPVFVEGTAHFVSKQTRVATARGEVPTDRHTTLDLLAGGKFWRRISLQIGVKNVTNQQYVNHLNAKNPFTSMQIPEPGRIIYGDVNIQF